MKPEYPKTMIDKLQSIIDETDRNFAPYYDVIPNLIRTRGYTSMIEIGVFCAGHCKAILDNSPLKMLVGIDPYKMYPQSPLLNIDNQDEWDCLYEIAMKRLDPHRYTHIRATSDKAIMLFPDINKLSEENRAIVVGAGRVALQSFDIVFIDGNHTAEALTNDLNNYEKLIRKGGVLSIHDFRHPTFPELTPVIENFAKQHNSEIHIGPLHLVWIDKTWE